MITALLHSFQLLRISFSFYLLPVYLFALSQALSFDWRAGLGLGFILHLLVYPASNGYNSYMDRDSDSIGGLEKPPPPPALLFPLTLTLDFLALGLSFWIKPVLGLSIGIYILISRLYSYRGIRLKRYPWVGFLSVSIFQGFWIFMSVSISVCNWSLAGFFNQPILGAAMATSFMVGGAYPLTQIFQHKSDARDGVMTLSMKLGYRNTFHFSMLMFTIFTGLLFFYFRSTDLSYFGFLLIFLVPVLFWFGLWYRQVRSSIEAANFKNTMRMNTISAVCLNGYFIFLLFLA